MNAVLTQIKSCLDWWESWVAALMTARILCSMKLKKKLLKNFFFSMSSCVLAIILSQFIEEIVIKFNYLNYVYKNS